MMKKLDIKELEEWQMLKYFKNAYADFPKARIVKAESPDFLIKIGRHRSIGLEMTKLFLQKKNVALDYFIPLYEGEKAQIISQLQEKLEDAHSFPFFAHISFSDKDFDRIPSLDFISSLLFELIQEALMPKNANQFFSMELKSNTLPPWFQSIAIVHHPSDKILKLVSCKEDIPYENILESLFHSIDMKEEKLSLYEKNWCDEYWLLIIAECLHCAAPFQVNNLLEKIKISSKFHRIILFEMFSGKVHHLL